MSKKNNLLRGVVLTWTILTTAFFWTSSMRILFKPEISSWRIFNWGGKGALGQFWIPPIIVLFALLIFYLEGRGKLRWLFHTFLIGWHFIITSAFIWGGFKQNSKITFRTWGISIDLFWLISPLLIFLILSIILTIKETKGHYPIPVFKWNQINWKLLGIAGFLVLASVVFFRLGSGFNLLIKIAVILTILQWILLTEGLGRPES